MTRECYGDAFSVDGVRYYRCFRDGTVLTGEAGETCGHCLREVRAKAHGEARTVKRAVLEIEKGLTIDVGLPDCAA